MRLLVDVDSQTLIESIGVLSPKSTLFFKRSINAILEVQFVRDGAVIELPPDATGIFGVKPTGHYDEDDYVTAALAWIKSGTGEGTLYTFNLSFINSELDALFFVDGNPLNDVTLVKVMAELQWVTTGFVYKTQTLEIQIVNDVNRGGETMADMPSIAIGIFLPNIIRLVGGTEIDLDAVPTVQLRLGYVVQLQVAAGLTWEWQVYELKAWPDGYVLLPSDVAPLDYNSVTNAKYWRGAAGMSFSSGAETLVEVVAAEDLDAFTFVTADGFAANSSNSAHIGHVAGMTREAVATGFIASLMAIGEVTNPAWAWADASLKLFLNGAAPSTIIPTTGFVQPVGLTRNPQTIIVALGVPIRL